MNARLITNPYIIYSAGFIAALLIYTLNWSALYPSLTVWLIIFVIGSVLFSLLIGLLLHKKNYLRYQDVHFSTFWLWGISGLILAGVLFECAYLGVVPLVAILNGQSGFQRTEFGIPTYHVFIITFASFWATFVFHNFISQKKKHLLVCYIVCLVPAVINFSREMLLMNLTSAFFILFMSSKSVVKLTVKLLVAVMVILFLFGTVGNLRESHGSSANDIILTLGKATSEFKSSSVPKEFFWSYIYISSPLANLQQTINKHDVSPFSFQKLGTFMNRSFLPDFISKRIEYFMQPKERIDQILFAFTVGTTYALCYAYLGWWGILLMFLYIMFFNILVILIVPRTSKFFITGIAILNCIMLFSLFDNMIAVTSSSFPLFYVVLFGILGRVKLFNNGEQKKDLLLIPQ